MAKKRKSRASQPSVEEPVPMEEPQEQINEAQQEQEQEQEQEHTANDDVLGKELVQEGDENAQNLEENKEKYEQEEEDDAQEEDEEEESEEETTVNEVKVEANGGGGGEETEDLDEEPVEKLLEPFSKEQLLLLLKEAVSKHPEFIESVQKIADADPAHRKIFVHGLGWDTNSEILTSEFGKYGEIEDCKAVVDKVSGKSKGYAFILFKHRAGAQKALKEPQKKIGNRMTSCQLASAGPIPAPPPTAPPVSEYTQRKIFVSNVSAEIDPQKLLEFFSKFGEIDDGPLGLDKQTGKPRGFALFVYKSVETVPPALTPALGQALTALLATQGAGLGNLLGLGGPVNPQGMPPAMNNPGYGNQAGASYGAQPGMQGGYPNPQFKTVSYRPQSTECLVDKLHSLNVGLALLFGFSFEAVDFIMFLFWTPADSSQVPASYANDVFIISSIFYSFVESLVAPIRCSVSGNAHECPSPVAVSDCRGPSERGDHVIEKEDMKKACRQRLWFSQKVTDEMMCE
ncbi:Nuclear envelope, Cut8 [Cynara cardunculus var. scolymus]|uniref:Nuclear envelope, Cut8 n=1 Tax=Cynara cardunculus var. scolymus TaxID=59895 RepID=A0A118JRZ4_CYNCS|nr:Nuclear envelope, Cut8 [Cynara cardunculus var. scolymus]